MDNVSPGCHNHEFMGPAQEAHERRTRIVIGLTASMMVLEIAAGTLFGSMALLADGWHMASHAAALSITAFGYYFGRRYASDQRFSFGTGKMGELAGFSSALLLALIAILMAYESVKRFTAPVEISFDEAIAVAAVGLIVNLVSAVILKDKHAGHDHAHHHTDHNFRAAYLHVLADALTSILAIVALATGRFLGWVWMDPMMGIVGAVVILRWSYQLIRDTGRILLDMNSGNTLTDRIRQLVESDGKSRITDLHVWRVAPRHFSAILSVVTQDPRPPDHYKAIITKVPEVCHVTVEVNPFENPSHET